MQVTNVRRTGEFRRTNHLVFGGLNKTHGYPIARHAGNRPHYVRDTIKQRI